jgi:hypothetical protein
MSTTKFEQHNKDFLAITDGAASAHFELKGFYRVVAPPLPEVSILNCIDTWMAGNLIEDIIRADTLPCSLIVIPRTGPLRSDRLYHPFAVWFLGATQHLRRKTLMPVDDMIDSYSDGDNSDARDPDRRQYGPAFHNKLSLVTLVTLMFSALKAQPSTADMITDIDAAGKDVRRRLKYFQGDRDAPDDDNKLEAFNRSLERLRSTIFELFDTLMEDTVVKERSYYADAVLEPYSLHPKTLDTSKPFAVCLSEEQEESERQRRIKAQQEQAELRKAREEKRLLYAVEQKKRELAKAESRAAEVLAKKTKQTNEPSKR